MSSTLEAVRDDLQVALDQGWKAFVDSEMPEVLGAFTRDVLGGERWFESRFRRSVPHPAHERMARLVGKEVPRVLIRHGIQLDQHWPGDFAGSSEAEDGEFEIRTFHLTVHQAERVLGRLAVSWPHKHGDFVVPQPPAVTVIDRV